MRMIRTRPLERRHGGCPLALLLLLCLATHAGCRGGRPCAAHAPLIVAAPRIPPGAETVRENAAPCGGRGGRAAAEPAVPHAPSEEEQAASLGADDPVIRAQALVGLRAREDVSESVRARIIALGRDPDETVRSEAILEHRGALPRGRQRELPDAPAHRHVGRLQGRSGRPRAAPWTGSSAVPWPSCGRRWTTRRGASGSRRDSNSGTRSTGGSSSGDSAEREIEGGSRDDWVDDALVLQRFGNRGVAAALRILGEALESSPDPEDRVRAAQALGDLGAQARPLLEVLAEVAADDWQPDEVRQAAQEATTHIAPE